MLHQYVSGNFPTFGGTGPPEIATAAPTAIGSGGKANQGNSKNQYCEPSLAPNWKPIGDVAAMLLRRLGAADAIRGSRSQSLLPIRAKFTH